MSKYEWPFKAPGDELNFDTPMTASMAKLLGIATRHESVGFSKSQDKNLRSFYGVSDELDIQTAEQTLADIQARYEEQLAEWQEANKLQPRTPEYKAAWSAYNEKWSPQSRNRDFAVDEPKPPNGESSLPLLRAGSTVNVYRWVQRDGLRVMAFLAKYLEKGQDPVKLVAQLCIEAGYDVPDDHGWIFDDFEDDPE